MRHLFIVVAVFLCLHTGHIPGVHAAGVVMREIQSTLKNQEHFALIQKVLNRGKLTEEACGPEASNIQRCVQKCNSPGSIQRDGCCCMARNKILSLGIAGGCVYVQQLLNYTSGDRLRYQSSPVDSTLSLSYFDDECKLSAEGTQSHDCSCVLSWDVKWTEVEAAPPLPSPTDPNQKPSPKPKPKPTTSASVAPSQKPSPKPKPSKVPREKKSPKPSQSPSSSADQTTGQGESTSPVASPSDSVSGTTDNPSSQSDEGSDDQGASTDEPAASSDVDGGVCVDETYLKARGFSANDMVHQTSSSYPVLCPSYHGLPCGTVNHKVRVNGVSFSYQQLCEREGVSCRRDVRKVNSVWTHQWKDAVHGDVLLTMYDVRYSESAQRLLHRVMRSVRL